jgi:CubicO group peptidase (beta-lactamase class C family)
MSPPTKRAARATAVSMAALALALVTACADHAPKPTDLLTEQAIADWLAPAMTQGYVHGIVIAQIDDTGSASFGYGTVGTGSSAPTGSTLFQIDSVTKTFTGLWLGVESLQASGGLSLTDPVQQFLPASSVTVPQYAGTMITLRDLTTHTSGLPDAPTNLVSPDPLNPWATYQVSDLYAFLNGFTLPYAPATQYAYSNVGEGLLGLALSLRASQSYEAGLHAAVLAPLGLDDTVATLSSDQASRAAPGHDGDLDAAEAWQFTQASAGAGSLWSTADDLLTYAAAQAQLTSTPLDAAIALSHQVQFADSAFGQGIGLNWIIKSPDFIWHNGGSYSYSAFVGVDPISHKGVVVLCDTGTSGTPTPVWGDLTTTIGMTMLSWEQGTQPPALASLLPTTANLTTTQLSAFAGSYALSGVSEPLVVSVVDGQLKASASWLWPSAVRLYPTSTSGFVSRVVPATITFSGGAGAAPATLTLEIYGQSYTGSAS